MRKLIYITLLFVWNGNIQVFSQYPSSKPNIILIVADDLGWKDVGFMGSDYYETPNLDALAKQSMIFTDAYAAAANCAPSRACMYIPEKLTM